MSIFMVSSDTLLQSSIYSECYLNNGFTTVLANDGIEKPQCVLCHAVLSAESMKPSKVNRHLEMKHPEHIQQVSLSNNTIQRRISKMSIDVKEQVLIEIKSSPLFSFQLDESTDVSSCSQLLVFVRYINSGDIKDEFLFSVMTRNPLVEKFICKNGSFGLRKHFT
ncbi:protein FAM200C-like [Tachypleus tridentatus]|uniref:protein FAM200C-like n=1 Tax=Tachypleus tridentatus TaxID=6853 RepID=UPI003FD17D81